MGGWGCEVRLKGGGGLNSGNLGGGNSNIFGIFNPKPGEMIQFDGYFSNELKLETTN